MTLVRAPHHVATPIAIVADDCFQLDAFFSWLSSHSSLIEENVKNGIRH